MSKDNSNISRKKSSDSVRLLLPVFIDRSIDSVEINFEDIQNGACLYGDISKREGLCSAMQWAEKNGKNTRVAEIVVGFQDKSAQGVKRLDEKALLSGKYGMVRFEKYAVKIDLYEKISEIICVAGREKYSNHPSKSVMTAEEWLAIDPSIASVLFDIYPIEIVVVATKTKYIGSGNPVTTAVMKDRSCIMEASMMYEPGSKVTIL